MPTREELELRLASAQAAERTARTRAARLRREMVSVGRRRDTQYRCALGGVLVALAARGQPSDLNVMACVRTYLLEHPPHASNAEVLTGTPFDPELFRA